ncbi:hypothetical protein PVAND_009879 [Polypedilum vanderplanki]|uniref:NTF2 domain-containing protein n=1 Tax=Polypedilum vanderplanki TaxID=319348 RepID=A0A9J6CE51_POLVA|nr:hypothetical protein PVAND_009879 [Polypedilum vanderplanki]
MDSIFETLSRHSSGTVKTFVNESNINYLKNFAIPNRINMSTGEHAIMVSFMSSKTFTPLDCLGYQESNNNSNWHLILIYHEGIFPKEDILAELYEIADESLFIPMAYRRNENIDYFFVCQQNGMIKNLIEKNLQICVKGYIFPLVLKMDVSNQVAGHIKPIKSILSLILRKIKDSDSSSLDYSNVSSEKEMAETLISLGNKATLTMFLDQLNQIKTLKANLRVLKFDNNNIKTLEPFSKKLYGFNGINVLSLNNNQLKDINELEYLKHMNLQEIFIDGNFGVHTTNAFMIKYEKKVQKLLPTLKRINGQTLTNAVHQDISSIKKESNEISNVGDGVLVNIGNIRQHRCRKLQKEYCWTKVTFVHNKRFSESEIMKHVTTTLLNDVYFFPCYFKRVGDRDEFFLYKNLEALEKLFNSGLKIRMPTENNFIPRNSFPVTISFNFNVSEYNDDEIFWFTLIISVLSDSIKENVLDLNNFPRRPEFHKMIVPMTKASLEFIMTQAKRLNPNITRIDIENCDLTSCVGFDSCLYTFPKLTCINLRNNKISTLHGFKNCPMIHEIFLDENPICNRSPKDYVAHIIEYLPNVKFIDGLKLNEQRSLVYFQNYLIKSNCYPVVNTFISQFFETWDSFERTKLVKMYKSNSVFTFSIYYDNSISSNLNVSFAKLYPRIQALITLNRNLNKISNMNQVMDNVCIGEKNIEIIFQKLPKTKHHFPTFTIDVPLYEPKNGRMMIVVGGVFEDFESELSTATSIPMAFSRTFLILSIDGVLKIQNDQITINAPTSEQINTMKYNQQVNEAEVISQCKDLLPTEAEERAMKLLMLQELTQCNKEYCHKLLSESFYDFKVALACFTTAMDANQITDDKFVFNLFLLMSIFEAIQTFVWFDVNFITRRNLIVTVISSFIFFTAWWIIMAVSFCSVITPTLSFHFTGILSTISFLMVNAIS